MDAPDAPAIDVSPVVAAADVAAPAAAESAVVPVPSAPDLDAVTEEGRTATALDAALTLKCVPESRREPRVASCCDRNFATRAATASTAPQTAAAPHPRRLARAARLAADAKTLEAAAAEYGELLKEW